MMQRTTSFEGFQAAYEQACVRVGVVSSVISLAHSPENCRVSITSKPVSLKFAAALAEVLKNDAYVQELSLCNTFIGDAGVAMLTEALHCHPSVRSIVFKGNNIRLEGGDALANLLQKNTSLSKLCIEWNYLGNNETGILNFMKALATNRTLSYLDLRNNGITDTGCHAIATALRQNQALQVLDLRYNKILDAGVRTLCEALRSNRALTHLEVSCEARARIVQVLKENCSSRQKPREETENLKNRWSKKVVPSLWDDTEKNEISELHLVLHNKQLDHEKARNAELGAQISGLEAETRCIKPELATAQDKIRQLTSELDTQKKSAAESLRAKELEYEAKLLQKDHELKGVDHFLRMTIACHEEELRKAQFSWEMLIRAQELQWQRQKDDFFTQNTAQLTEIETLHRRLQEVTANARASSDAVERSELQIQELRSSLATEVQKVLSLENEVDLKKQEIHALRLRAARMEEQTRQDQEAKDKLQSALEKARLEQENACERIREELRRERADWEARMVSLRRDYDARLDRQEKLNTTLKEEKDLERKKQEERQRELEALKRSLEDEVHRLKLEAMKAERVFVEKCTERDSERLKNEELAKSKQSLSSENTALKTQLQKWTEEANRNHADELQAKNVTIAQLRDEVANLQQCSITQRKRLSDLESGVVRQRELLKRDMLETVRNLFRQGGECSCGDIIANA